MSRSNRCHFTVVAVTSLGMRDRSLLQSRACFPKTGATWISGFWHRGQQSTAESALARNKLLCFKSLFFWDCCHSINSNYHKLHLLPLIFIPFSCLLLKICSRTSYLPQKHLPWFTCSSDCHKISLLIHGYISGRKSYICYLHFLTTHSFLNFWEFGFCFLHFVETFFFLRLPMISYLPNHSQPAWPLSYYGHKPWSSGFKNFHDHRPLWKPYHIKAMDPLARKVTYTCIQIFINFKGF